MGLHKLVHDRFKQWSLSHAVAVCMDVSPCGNFCVLGYSSGHIDVYNMQSGIYRGSYGKDKGKQGKVQSGGLLLLLVHELGEGIKQVQIGWVWHFF